LLPLGTNHCNSEEYIIDVCRFTRGAHIEHLVVKEKFSVFLCLKARLIAVVKNIDSPMLTRVWQEIEYRIDVCRVTRGAHIELL
jgi:hypothetical protein